MSTRAQLSETINRLLPGEKNKRIRESILAAATYSGSRTDQLRQSIDAANRVKTGFLVAGTTVIVTDTTADISGYVWVIDFAIKQPAALETIVILAPDATYAREDWFVGLSDGTIEYRSGTIDALGNSTPPVYDSATEVVLHRVTRNPDSTNTDIEIPAPSNLIDFIEQNIIPLVRDGKLTNSGIKAILDDLGAVIGYQFPTTVKGLPGTEEDEFVTKKQLPVISQYGLLNGGTILWTTVGFNFQWSPAAVAIGGECSAPSAEIPLTASDPFLNRVDLLGWLKTAPGVAVPHVIMGTPAPTFNPPPYDPTTFVVGIPVQIPAAATTPSGISTEVIYAENTGAPEWVPSSTGTGTSNPADIANPKSGTYAVKDSAVENGFKQIFTRATTINITTVTTFGLDAALIASLGAGQGWTIGFLDASGNPASNTIALPLIKSQLTYQVVAVNLDQFTFTTNSIKGIVFTYVKTKGPAVHAGIYLDNIKLQGGVGQPGTVAGIPEAPSDSKIKGRKNGAWDNARAVHIFYASQAAMLAGQADQEEGRIYFDGTADWIKKSTSTGVIADYRALGSGGGGSIDQDNKVRIIEVNVSDLPIGYASPDVINYLNALGVTIADKEIIGVNIVSTITFPSTGLISYYRLDELTGIVAADSFGSNPGAITGAILGVSGKIGTAFTFNGTSSFIDLGNPANLQMATGSVSCWIKTTTPGSSFRGVVVKQLAYSIFLVDGVLSLYSWGSPVGVKSTGINLADGLWHHIVLAFEPGTNLTLVYLDGVLVLTTTLGISNQTVNVAIGAGAVPATQFFNGDIDEVIFWSTKLNSLQVSNLYNSGIGLRP